MPRRSFWRGYLKLSLVTCRVVMAPVVSDLDRVRFHTLNRKTGHRIETRYVDAETGATVADKDEVKGYPRGPDEYVMLEDKELDAVALESTRTIDIEMFVPRASIAWIWYDVPHFLTPDDEVGEEAFAVIREAMRASGTAGIARLVLNRRERAVMLEPRGQGMILWSLRYGDEVRPEAEYFKGLGGDRIEKGAMAEVRKLIEARRGEWSPKLVSDPVEAELRKLIRRKARATGAKPNKKAAPGKDARGDNVIDLMAALKKSLNPEG
jgi:DNA end-binding protein Ku